MDRDDAMPGRQEEEENPAQGHGDSSREMR